MQRYGDKKAIKSKDMMIRMLSKTNFDDQKVITSKDIMMRKRQIKVIMMRRRSNTNAF
jgi:hypothetical protein